MKVCDSQRCGAYSKGFRDVYHYCPYCGCVLIDTKDIHRRMGPDAVSISIEQMRKKFQKHGQL